VFHTSAVPFVLHDEKFMKPVVELSVDYIYRGNKCAILALFCSTNSLCRRLSRG
jgi:hypothetical protein